MKKSPPPLSQDALIRHLAKLLDETHLTEIEIESDQGRVRVARQTASISWGSPSGGAPSTGSLPLVSLSAESARPSAPLSPTESPIPSESQGFSHHPGAVKSPMVGTSYMAPSPEAPPFVTEGALVNKGDTLMVIEAMKLMNPIKAPRSGKVKKILCHNAEPVEFDQVLMILE